MSAHDPINPYREPRILTLGLTGGIGSGKSYVSRLLEAAGLPVYDSDRRAKELYDEDTQLRGAVQELCGADVYDAETERLDRALLASRIFADPRLLQQVNALVHPAVRRDFQRWRHEQLEAGAALCALESALLLDSGLRHYVDRVVVVAASEALRLTRAMARDGVGAEAIQQRMARQRPQAELIAEADHVLYNEPDSDLEAQVSSLLASLA